MERLKESDPLIDRMLTTAELFYYSHKFRDQVFVILVRNLSDFQNIIQDLSVITGSHIKTIVLIGNDSNLAEEIDYINKVGEKFSFHSESQELKVDRDFISRIKGDFEKSLTPVLPINLEQNLKDDTLLQNFIFEFAAEIKALKLIFTGFFPVLKTDKTIHRISPEEIESVLETGKTNIAASDLRFLIDTSLRSKMHVVLIEPRLGSLYTEIFTHLGSGTLIAEQEQEVFRKATVDDIEDIYYMMLPYIQEGSVLSINQYDILKSIDDYFIYVVDDVVVAALAIIDRGEAFEIGKLCTLPRYRKRGISDQLLSYALESLKGIGKEYAFALSVNPSAWQLLERVGFSPVSRGTLPKSWQKTYDMDRLSKAFRFELTI